MGQISGADQCLWRTLARHGIEDDRPVRSADDAGMPPTGFTDLYPEDGHSAF
jgi:hypothetical protein